MLVASYALQIGLAMTLARAGPWPYAVVVFDNGHGLAIAALLACGALQTYALIGLYRSAPSKNALAWTAAAMLAISLVAPVLTNADLYAYVGNGILGRTAYLPPRAPFAGDLSIVNMWWGAPMAPATYGPLWLVLAHAIAAAGSTLALKLLAFRIAAALCFGALFVAMRAYGIPVRLLALLALNPAFYFQFVLNAHNDILACAIVAAAAVLARNRPALAAALIATAALVKAPYALAGLPVLAVVRPAAQRYTLCAFAIVAAVAVSWFAGGAPYASALLLHVNSSHMESSLHAIAMVAAIAAIAAAVAGMRRLRAVVWLLPMLGAYTAAWYAAWSLPYAMGRRRVLLYLLVWFPVISIVAEPSLSRPWTVIVLVPLIVAFALLTPARRYGLQGGPS